MLQPCTSAMLLQQVVDACRSTTRPPMSTWTDQSQSVAGHDQTGMSTVYDQVRTYREPGQIPCSADRKSTMHSYFGSLWYFQFFLASYGQLCPCDAGAGDGMVKFWDLRKADQVGWHLQPPSPTPQQGLTPTQRRKLKVRHNALEHSKKQYTDSLDQQSRLFSQ